MTAPLEISFPFRVAPSGQIAVESDPDQQVMNHLVALVGTQPTERTMLTNYGVPTMLSIFEPDDEFIGQQLLTTIQNAVALWEPGVQILSVSLDASNQTQGVVAINVEYTRVNAGANTPINPNKVFTATILTDGDIR